MKNRIALLIGLSLTLPSLVAAHSSGPCEKKLTTAQRAYQAFKDDIPVTGLAHDKASWKILMNWVGGSVIKQKIAEQIPKPYGPAYLNFPVTDAQSDWVKEEIVFDEDISLPLGPIVKESIQFMIGKLEGWNSQPGGLRSLRKYRIQLIKKLKGVSSPYSSLEIAGLCHLFLNLADLHAINGHEKFMAEKLGLERLKAVILKSKRELQDPLNFSNPSRLAEKAYRRGFAAVPTPRNLGFTTLLDGMAHGVAFLGLTVEPSYVDGQFFLPHGFFEHDNDHAMEIEYLNETKRVGTLSRSQIVERRDALREFAYGQPDAEFGKLIELVTFMAVHEEGTFFHLDLIYKFLHDSQIVENIDMRMDDDDLGQAFSVRPTRAQIASAVKALIDFLDVYKDAK